MNGRGDEREPEQRPDGRFDERVRDDAEHRDPSELDRAGSEPSTNEQASEIATAAPSFG